MSDNSFSILYKFRFVLGGLLILGGLFLISFILSITSQNYKVHAFNSVASSEAVKSTTDDPNIITNLMSETGTKLTKTVDSTQNTLNNGLGTAASTVASVPASSFNWAKNVTQKQVSFIADVSSSTVKFIVQTPGKAVKSISSFSITSAAIRPADEVKVPVINAPETSSVLASNSPPTISNTTNQVLSANDALAQWPIHGVVTLEFGVAHQPYQPTHTGIDISDGKRSGTTSVKPFKPGKVVQVVRSNTGLGNHITVDHGGGIISVYGHLYSINVQVGQAINKNTVIGYEGSTGASTGTHLHFEIRINGQVVNPRKYITGHP